MNDERLQETRERLDAIDDWPQMPEYKPGLRVRLLRALGSLEWSAPQTDLVNNAPQDIADLLAEVDRLRARVSELESWVGTVA